MQPVLLAKKERHIKKRSNSNISSCLSAVHLLAGSSLRSLHSGICIVFFIFIVFFYTPTATGGQPETDDFSKRLNLLLKKPSLENASCGVHIISLKNGNTIFNHQSNKLFRVASNMKLLTTSAALVYLGPDFTYRTVVMANGPITTTGTLRGDVIIKGSGDPNLSGRFHNGDITHIPKTWIKKMKDMGIREITGDIIGDDTIFDRIYVYDSWPEDQLHEWYCAPVSGLAFNDNCVDITFVPQKRVGKKVKLLIEPNTSFVTIFNKCLYTADKKKHLYSLYRKPKTNQIYIRGKFWGNASRKKEWVSVHNPPLYLVTVFKEMLERYGIDVHGKARLIDKDNSEDLFLHTFKIAETASTMERSVYVTNKRSQNFYAEQILKTLGAHINGQGTSKGGLRVLSDFMGKLDFNPHEYEARDGCGLSSENKMTPEMITSLLYYMHKHEQFKVFYDSLPISGIDGGLRRRMASTAYKNKIRAKTGYIAGTSALSGYLHTQKGNTLAFSILMNEFKSLYGARKIQDEMCRIMVDYW